MNRSLRFIFICAVLLVMFAAWFGAFAEDRHVDLIALSSGIGAFAGFLYKQFVP